MIQQQAAMRFSTVLLWTVIAAALTLKAQAVPLSPWTDGTASFFGGPKDSNSNAYKLTINSGSCGYGDFDPRLYPFYHVVGLHKTNPLVANRPMHACGSCLEVQCTGQGETCNSRQPIQMIVTDQCDYDCTDHNVNIHVFGFEEVAPLRIGRTQVRYRLVECEPADPVTVHIMDYRATEGGWMRLALKNVAGDAALTAVEIAAHGKNTAAQNWMACKNTYGAVWETGLNHEQLPAPPLDLRITNSLNQQLVIRDFVAVAGMIGDVETTVQFPSPFVLPSGKSTAADDDTFTPPTRKAVSQVVEGVAIVRPVNALLGTALNNTVRGPASTGINLTSSPDTGTTVKAAEQPDTGANTVSMQVAEDKPYPGGAAPLNNGIPPNAVNVGSTAAQGPPKAVNQGPPQSASTSRAQPQTVPAQPTPPAQKLPIQHPLPTQPVQQPLPVFQPPVPVGAPAAKKGNTRPDVSTESAPGVHRVSTAPVPNRAGGRRFLQGFNG